MVHNEPLFLLNHLLLLLVEVVVGVISPTFPGLPRAVAEVERWFQNAKLPYPVPRLL
jgi:hypothetical protein